MENIAFVTGSSGKIGKELTNLLLKNNFTVVCVGRFINNTEISLKVVSKKFPNIFTIDKPLDSWSVYSEDDLIRLISFPKNIKIMTYFFHLAWKGEKTLTDGGYENQIVNIGTASKYLDLCKKLNIKKFINAGSIDEIYVKRIIESENYIKASEYTHFDYGIAKIATQEILSFKAYVEKINFIHTLTSIAIDNKLRSNNFIENNIKKILNGLDYDIPNNSELCNISTCSSIANNLFQIAVNGENQKTYFTGNNAIYKLEDYFELISLILKNKKVEIKKYESESLGILNYEDFNLKNKFLHKKSLDPIANIKNLINSIGLG